MLNAETFPAVRPRPADPWLFLAEVEHRVANEYALAVATLSLAASRTTSSEAKADLVNAAQRLRDYADMHRALQAPVSGEPIDLAEHLRRICGAFAHAILGERGVRLTLIEQSVPLSPTQCWRVGLIVFELIANSVRHGLRDQGGAITVEISRARGRIECRVADDGRSPSTPCSGEGTRVVDALVWELGGFIDRQFGEDGTMVVLAFSDRPDLCLAAAAPRH